MRVKQAAQLVIKQEVARQGYITVTCLRTKEECKLSLPDFEAAVRAGLALYEEHYQQQNRRRAA
ncbi:hypothetical protein [Telluribacter sp.]|uniref:hypothetical protein n=1 Tax=Telluribacter sp. TaxID=1978767 RepID=UPI002E1241B5|nr:hypothetical protein [Telluribacter sp.]